MFFCLVVEQYTKRIQGVGKKDRVPFQILTQTISTFEEENIAKCKSVQKERSEQKEINNYFIQTRQLVAQR